MIHHLPLVVMIFAIALTVLHFWREVLLICMATALTLLALGVIDVAAWMRQVR